jgi:ribosomal protein S18 acetylase RimI-like enzyme
VPEITDVAQIRAILRSDPAWSVYALGDLAPGYFEHCSWYIPRNGDRALALIYRGFTPPILFTLGDAHAISILLDEIGAEASYSLHVHPAVLPVLDKRYRIEEKAVLRMVIAPDDFKAAPFEDAVRLGPDDACSLERLYEDGRDVGESPEHFHSEMLRDGVFFGIREREDLVAAAGTHVVAPAESVGAVGNVYTRRDRRGMGLAANVTSAVITELLRMKLTTIGLNVYPRNSTAVRVYERLGFRTHCEFYTGIATARAGL